MTQTQTVASDMVVGLHYSLQLEDGQSVDSSEGLEPLYFLQGHGQIIPGLEQELYGMAVGDEKRVVVAPENGYGEYREDAKQVIDRDEFPPEVELEVGTPVELYDPESGETVDAFIAEIGDEEIELDFNHPLAGQVLHFDVQIAEVRSATASEMDHGHVHHPGHHHH